MYVVKSQDPQKDIKRLTDAFTNFYLGSLSYKDGKKLAKPIPGFPKITSALAGVELGVRFNSDLHLVCPATANNELSDSLQRIISHIVAVVTKRAEGTLVPVPQHRGHHYTKPQQIAIRLTNSVTWSAGPDVPGVFWDYTDCLSVADGQTIVSPGLVHFKRGSMLCEDRSLRYVVGATDPCVLNYHQWSYSDHMRMFGSNTRVRCSPDTDPSATNCSACGRVLYGISFQQTDGDAHVCLVCRLQRRDDYIAHELSDDRVRHARELVTVPEQEEVLDDLRGAELIKAPNGVNLLVGRDHVFSRNVTGLVHGECIPEIKGKKLIPARIFDIEDV